MERGYKRLNDADKQAFLKLGYTVLAEKKVNRAYDEYDFVVYKDIKVYVYRYNGALVFNAELAQSKYGCRPRDTWNGYDDEPKERQARPNNIFTGITKAKVEAWLDHCVMFYHEKIAKYEAMLKLYEERLAECVDMGGEWVFAHHSYWDKKEGKLPEKSSDDYFTVTAGVFTFKKTVYGIESLEFMNWKVDDYKKLFLQIKSQFPEPKPKNESYTLEYSLWNGSERLIADADALDPYEVRLALFKSKQAVKNTINELSGMLEEGVRLNCSINKIATVEQGEVKAKSEEVK